MLFTSLQFAFFFVVIVTLYFSIPHRYRWILLLGGSYFFYMCWNWKYIGLIILSTLIDYFAGSRMSALPERAQRRKYLVLSLLTNLGLLFIFKYFNLFSDSMNAGLSFFGLSLHIPYIHVLLPVGISFYTFQTLSYSIDVYRGKIEHEKHLGIFALYVSFFPQLVAGPIERASRLLPQFYRENKFDEARVVSGLRLMLWGLFKKIVVANRLALYVDAVYNNAELHSGLTLLIATYMFAFQIYCDFSGYSDIAIGAARVLGYDLMKNFNRPYFARTINEFWSRWHISLSTWFRDYLYIPLGGNRKGAPRMFANLVVVFLVSGLWHGANWTFVIWGGLHGIYSLVDTWIRAWCKPALKSSLSWIQKSRKILVTFHLVLFSWVLFRANSMHDAGVLFRHMFNFSAWSDNGYQVLVSGIGRSGFLTMLTAIVFMETIHILERRQPLSVLLSDVPIALRWGFYHLLLLSILLLGVFEQREFIYFQF